MADVSPQDSSDLATARAEALDELRELLLAPEQSRLEQLQERLDNPVLHAHDISLVLPEAIELRRKSDGSLAHALTPLVEEAITTSIRKTPQVIVDVIAPIMGPAIRRSIVQAIQGMVQSLNQTLEHSMSVQGLRWRVEAWKTGRPFAEVVLLHTLLYRVEQVFLIHRETGLLLQHVSAAEAAIQDEQLVSGMLTAIRQFVRDSFGAREADTLDHFQVGDHTVWIEQGPRALLAGVIRGAPPLALRQVFREQVDHIHARHAEAFARFDGDSSLFGVTHPSLEACLQSQQGGLAQQKPTSSLWVLGAVLLLGLSAWGWLSYQAHQRWANFLSLAKAEPGLVITAADSTFSGYRIDGLRDPLAKDPALLLHEAGIDPAEVSASWGSYYALDPRLIAQRAHSILRPPATVTLSMTDAVLTATGSASLEWAREAKRVAALIPGVAEFQDGGLRILALDELVRRINDMTFHFAAGSSAIEPAEQALLSSLMAAMRELDQAAASANQRVSLDVVGSTDASGPAAMNEQLAQARAQTILAALGGERFGFVTRLAAKTGMLGVSSHRPARRGSAEQRVVFLRAAVGPHEQSQSMLP